MSEIHFEATIGDDRVIHPPVGIVLPAGIVKVTVRSAEKPDDASAEALAPTRTWLLAMAAEAEQMGPDFPADLAENHDYYAHGRPRQ